MRSAPTPEDVVPAPPLPSLTADTRPFFTRGAQGELAIHRCGACRRYAHPPTPRCPACLSSDVAPTAVSGRAVVASYTVDHYPWHPAFETPYVIAIVELSEQPGLRLTTRIVGEDALETSIDDEVEVTFEAHGEIYLPLFRRTGGRR